MITLDTSGLLAIVRTDDPFHGAFVDAVRADPGPYIIPAGILGEVTYMLERTTSLATEQTFLSDVHDGAYTVDWHVADLPRVQHLLNKYHDLPLGFVDAAVAVCAERYGGRVLTTDRRHFDVLARGERQLQVLPNL